MELLRPLAALCILLAFVAAAAATEVMEIQPVEVEARSSYIVHVAAAHAPRLPRRGLLTTRSYGSFLRDHVPAEISSPATTVLYYYSHAATGFAARLTGRQAAHLASSASVLAVVPDAILELHTTLTPSFGLLPASNAASVVIRVIDSGVYPEGRASLATDQSLRPLPPGKFHGGCVSGPSFNGSALCNNKLVGSKFFHKGHEAVRGRALGEDSESPLDTSGHGTHTASTAAGSAAADAGFYGCARGKAYKRLWKR